MTAARRLFEGALLCTALLIGSCSTQEPAANRASVTGDTPGDPVGEPTAQSVPTDEMPGVGPSEFEQEVIDAMVAAGVSDPGVDEDGFTTATVSGGWDGMTAWVHAYAGPDGATPGEVVDDVVIGGLPAQVVRTEFFGEVLSFQCRDLGYQVTVLVGDRVAGSGTVAAAVPLAEVLLPALGCSQ